LKREIEREREAFIRERGGLLRKREREALKKRERGL